MGLHADNRTQFEATEYNLDYTATRSAAVAKSEIFLGDSGSSVAAILPTDDEGSMQPFESLKGHRIELLKDKFPRRGDDSVE